MSVNLIGLVKDAVSQQVMNKIGGMVGLEPAKTSSVFDTAVGSILGGLMKKATGSGGTDAVFGAVQSQDPGLLDRLNDILDGDQARGEFEEQGGGILDMVFGGDRAKAESGIGSALGIDSGMIGKLLAMAAPIIMGVIGRYVKNKAMDAVGLGNLLGEQKQHLGSVMPAGLASNLGLSNFVEAPESAAPDGRVQASSPSGTSGSGGLMKMLLPLIVIAALLFGLWQFVLKDMMTKGKDVLDSGIAAVGDGANAVGDQVKAGVDGAKNMTIPGMDLEGINLDALGGEGQKIATGIQDITTNFKDLTTNGTEEMANGMVEKLNGFGTQLENLNVGEMAAPAKTAASGLLGKFKDTINELLAKVPAPLDAIVKPAVEGLLEKINGLGL